MLGKQTVQKQLSTEDQYFSSLVSLVCLTLMSDGGKLKESGEGVFRVA